VQRAVHDPDLHLAGGADDARREAGESVVDLEADARLVEA
jgi:hypothetical protein